MFLHIYEEKREKNLITCLNCENNFTIYGMIMDGIIGYADEKQSSLRYCFCRSKRLHIFIIYLHITVGKVF